MDRKNNETNLTGLLTMIIVFTIVFLTTLFAV